MIDLEYQGSLLFLTANRLHEMKSSWTHAHICSTDMN